MNERIRELAGQLVPVAIIGNWGRVEWIDNVYPQLGDKMYAAIDLQKFAESIIQKCAGVAEVSMPINSHPDDRLTVKNSVLKHFGVEG